MVGGVLVGGVLGRVVMSISAIAAGPEAQGIVTENGNIVGEFTVAGTVGLILFGGVFAGLIGSVLVVASAPWMEWMGSWRGAGYGLAALAGTGAAEMFESIDFLILDPVGLNIAMFLALPIIYGFSVPLLEVPLERRLPQPRKREQVGYILLVAAGGFPLFMTALLLSVPGFCGCEPAYGIGIVLLALIGATGVYHLAVAGVRVPGWVKNSSRFVGYTAMAAFVLLGTMEVVDQIRSILRAT